MEGRIWGQRFESYLGEGEYWFTRLYRCGGGFVSIQLLKVGYPWIVKSDGPQQGKGDVKDAMKSMEKGRAATASSTKKLMNFSENFEAKLFLSPVHQDTSGADLKSGALGLKTDLKGRTRQRKLLVKDNFDCFVSCKTTIDGILAQTEKIRSVQGMLQSFRTLFNLPSTICRSSSKGEHDLAVREYNKAMQEG
ncbi:hypothetical protein Dsin_024274 [Dipteronia sinensis]|uniref:Exocyst complex component SEC5 n=1 Tax=Dipteronia sinensis TaxID=43782 RepID=A0AAE0DX87_9ROSI|nr:hypothetical protein Dsin_024274 [Dipteronia sinensis]